MFIRRLSVRGLKPGLVMRFSTSFSTTSCLWFLLLLLPASLLAQPATVAPALLTGTAYELTTTNAQLQPTGRMVLHVTQLTASARATKAVLHQQIFDAEGRMMTEADLPARIVTNGPVLLDVRAFVNAQLLHALQLGDLRVETDSLVALPTAATPAGELLPDASLTLTGWSGQNPRGVQITLFGRWLAGSELVATPAGTFDCQRLTQNLRIESFVAGARRCYNLRLISWIAPGTGLVRAETYAGNTLFDTTVLSRILPPDAVPPTQTVVVGR
jgi:hypothetical protein